MDLDVLRHELAEIEAALEDPDTADRAKLEARQRELDEQIAAAQNPVEPSRVLVNEHGEVLDPATVDPKDYVPPAGELVLARPDDDHGAMVVLDRHDEELIVMEFQRRALKVMLYDVPKGGGRAIDLSYPGVNEAVRLLNWMGRQQIGIVEGSLEVHVEMYDVGDGPEPHFVATVMAVNATIGYQQYGTASEPQWMKLKRETAAKYRREGKQVREDDRIFDVFSRAKAINKAQRNALKVQIPETMRQTLIAQYKGDETALRQIKAGAGAQAIAELPAPLDDDEAKTLRHDVEAAFLELRGLSKLRMLPAVYQAELARSAHSHEMLRALRARIQGLVLEEKRKAEVVA